MKWAGGGEELKNCVCYLYPFICSAVLDVGTRIWCVFFFALSVRNVREDVAGVSGWCIIAPQSSPLLQELSLKMEH